MRRIASFFLWFGLATAACTGADGMDRTEEGVDGGAVPDASKLPDPMVPIQVEVGLDTAADPLADLTLTTHVVGGALEVRTNLSPWAEDCPEVMGVSCVDLDGDSLLDAWEEKILQRVRPRLVFDENESMFEAGHEPVMVGRVALVNESPLQVHVFIPILYARDFGACNISAHNGDSERVVVQMVESLDGLKMQTAYTAAHEGTPTSQSRARTGADLLELVYEDDEMGNARWVVYPSRDKHGTYATLDHCHSAVPLPCFNEECFPDDVEDESAFMRLPDIHHAGELDAPLLQDLTPLGFPGEDAWLDQSFCGGLDRGVTCSGSVRKKLTEVPF